MEINTHILHHPLRTPSEAIVNFVFHFPDWLKKPPEYHRFARSKKKVQLASLAS